MTPAQVAKMDETIREAIQLHVNGKIDGMRLELGEIRRNIGDHNVKHEADMARMMPVIEAFEEGQRDIHSAKKAGKIVLWLAATVTAIGGAYLIIIQIFRS